MKKTLLLMLSLAIGYMASAQTIISGTVVDEKNQPIVGALVAIPNTSQRTATDLNGSFIIEVPKGTTEIEIDNIGYRTKSIECNTDNSSYSAGFITMQENKGYEKSNEIFRLGVEARFDYLNQALEGNQLYDASGFKVRYFNLRMDGQITPKFTYSWRQRFNNINKASDFVNNTDWLHLTYKPTDNWAISAGKQVVMIGGFEYDYAPIDVYYCSEYWNNVNCFQLGVSASYITNDGDALTFQICQSPYHNMLNNIDYDGYKLGDLYAYNLYWSGTEDFYTALHSLNFSEYERGKFDVYLVLGNQFKFDKATIQFDLMSRGTTFEQLLGDNFSTMFKADYLIAKRVNVFAKVTYDKVGEEYPAGLFLWPGTEMTRVGGGVEYYPLGAKGNRDIRLHAAYAYNIGNNTNPDGTAFNTGSFLTFGLTWKIDVLQGITSLVEKIQSKR